MKEKDLPIDRARHAVYTKKAKKCVLGLLHRNDDDQTCLIREGTCVESPCCDYCIVGDSNPIAREYELVKKENGLLVSVKKKAREICASRNDA